VKYLKKILKNNSSIPDILFNFYKNIMNLEFEERPSYEKYIESFRQHLLLL